MPVYTYRCENCGVQFDKTQKFTDNSLTRCPECGKKSLRKVYQPVGIVFKGSGFYSTDNRSPSGSRSNGSHAEDKDKPAETKSTDSKSTDSKSTDSKSTDSKSTDSKSTDTSKTNSTNEKAEKKD